MKTLMFMRRFVPAIMGGIKTSTIRASGRIQVGDIVSMRYWSGLPYRSKTVEFFRARITSKTWVGMDCNAHGMFLWVGRRKFVSLDERDRIARREGFGDWRAWFSMAEWFISNHDMPFAGYMLSWEPKLLPKPGECITTDAQAALAKDHGTPSQFWLAVIGCPDLTVSEATNGYLKYAREWREAGRKV